MRMLRPMTRTPARFWDDGFPVFGRQLNSLFDDEDFGELADWKPAVDVKERDDTIEVTADIPGVDPNNIDVEFDNNMLTIRGHRSDERHDEGNGYRRVERYSGSFCRRIAVPEATEPEKIKAKSEHGVLRVTLPKAESARTRRIPIEA